MFPSTHSFPQCTHEIIEVWWRKLPLHLLWIHDIHENSSYPCWIPQVGSSEHEASFFFISLHFYVELKSTAHTRKKSCIWQRVNRIFSSRCYCSPKPISQVFDPKEINCPKRRPEAVLLHGPAKLIGGSCEEGAGKTIQDQPTVEILLNSCSLNSLPQVSSRMNQR